MIYLLYGDNFKESRKKLSSLIESLLKKEPNASQFKIDADNFSLDFLQEMVEGQTLFFDKYIVVVDKIFQNKEFGEIILKELKNISKSQNIFIFLEESLSKTVLSRFQKWAIKTQEFPLKKEKTKEEKFNIFSITEALGNRDKKRSWVLYQKALSSGMVPEEIHGVIFWQIKNILMVKDEINTNKLDLNPYVLRKSLGFAEKFSKDELKKLSLNLVDIPHKARRGLEDFGISLEKFILSI